MYLKKLSETFKKAIDLARLGQGHVEPNPMVGCVVFDEKDQVCGEGFHQKFGEAHAEVNALQQAGVRAKGGTIVVTLEPCSHFGKTPPCTDALIKAGIKRVVIGMRDPFPRVNGSGIQRLQEANVSVEYAETSIEKACLELNAAYLKLLRAGMPWVIQKWAMTLDGKIATKNGESKWISNEESRGHVQLQRGLMDAIVVGAKTVWQDDPLLISRAAMPDQIRRIATRIICTQSGILPDQCQLLNTISQAPVLICTQNPAKLLHWRNAGAEIFVGDLQQLLLELGKRRMTNVYVEGGAQLHGAFLDYGLADEAHIYIAPKLFGNHQATGPIAGDGISMITNARRFDTVSVEQFGNDTLIRGRWQKHS